MNPALWVSQTGLTAQDRQLNTIANNLANVNTVGFKKDRVVFEDLFYQVQRQPGSSNGENSDLPAGMQLGSGVRVVGTQKVFTNGAIETTSNPMDVAITGHGFFKLTMPDGTSAFTRNGQFHVNADGSLVSAGGFLLDPEITIPNNATAVTIGNDGTVSVSVQGQTQPEEVGQITITNFVNPAGLTASGMNLYRESAASGEAVDTIPGEDGTGTLKQFAQEKSNVNMVEEMVAMITAQRGYEMNSKVISATDDMMKYVNQTL
ncbi:flagellar basal-body rod protein FlgG [Endozoicomonadaceae bacterium StTr2]